MISNYDIFRQRMQDICYAVLTYSAKAIQFQRHNTHDTRMGDPIIDDVKAVRGYQPHHGYNGTNPFLGMISNMTRNLNDCNLTSNLMNMQRQGN